MSLYPFRLEPEFRERVWGTRDLSPVYANVPGTEPVGEVWLTGDECRVTNGPLAGNSLNELCLRFERQLVGTTAPEPRRFPLLVKFLFPREKLSVQVHPDDDMARRIGQPCGKTECWYVLHAEPGAQVGLGLKAGVTRADFAAAIREVRAEQLLNWIDIHEGELIYVDAGTVHTIGPGSVLVETQQNSDTTFRLYDYGRPRQLHVREGMEAIKESTRAGKVATQLVDGRCTALVCSPCFRVEKLILREGDRMANRAGSSGASAQVLVGLEGCAVVESPAAAEVTVVRGEAVVVPAEIPEFSVRGLWNSELLRATVPGGNIQEPETKL